MSEATSPTKRRRTKNSSGDADSNATPVRSKIWMLYGDVILEAEGTQFRVNRDVLAQQSSLLKDMFGVPFANEAAAVEGCPIVRVTGTAKDWELLLGVLYHPFSSSACRPFDVVASMLRLGRKYDIPAAKDDASSRLHAEFPAEFQAWNSRDEFLTTIEDHSPSIYLDLLNLSYECGVYSCIPTLGLECLVNHSLDTLVAGILRSDGSRAILTSDIKLTLAIAAERIVGFQKKALVWLEGDAIIPHKSCRTHKTCIEQKMDIHHMAAWKLKDQNLVHDVRFTIHPWDPDWSGKLCDVCEEAAKDYYENSRHKGWELLPTFFGLGKWKDLSDSE
ncbi:hypothetical protein C8R45DRAFT_994060 [Mycena sanguinolenta]|nr:hypothetical protein C8R45DRAFT_994060 [Mycena sanguinolenta]